MFFVRSLLLGAAHFYVENVFERLRIMLSKFVNEVTELIVLACLAQKSSDSYSITTYIREYSIEGMKVSQCEVFTVLYSLCEKKYIESKKVALKDSRKRDLYILLPEGKVYYEKALENYKEKMNSVNQVLTNISFFHIY